MKLFLKIFVVCLLLVSVSAFGLTIQEKTSDALGRAYKASTEKNIDEALKYFKKASEFAEESGNWQALLDSGHGISTLGKPKDAKEVFTKAESIIIKSEDWHGAVALGYAYSSLPNNLNALSSASSMWDKSKTWASEKNDSFGLIESSRGFLSIDQKEKAKECLALAQEIVKEAPTESSVRTLVKAYQQLGDETKARECARYLENAPTTPPPGWKPTVVSTTREPKTVSMEAQQLQRSAADKQIEDQRTYESEKAQQEHEEKMQKQELAYQAYSDYMYYYSYPYYGAYDGLIVNYDDYYEYSWTTRPVWCERSYPEVYNWSLWNLNRYTYSNGIYIEIEID